MCGLLQELSQLELAYAVTVHKAQGGEARHVILALSRHHGRMLTRRLLYTGRPLYTCEAGCMKGERAELLPASGVQSAGRVFGQQRHVISLQ